MSDSILPSTQESAANARNISPKDLTGMRYKSESTIPEPGCVANLCDLIEHLSEDMQEDGDGHWAQHCQELVRLIGECRKIPLPGTREEPDFEWWRLQGINACIERMKTLAKERDDALALSTNTQTLMVAIARSERTNVDQTNHQDVRSSIIEECAKHFEDHHRLSFGDGAASVLRALKNAAPQVSSRPDSGGQSSDTDTPAVAALCHIRCFAVAEEERCVDCPERCDKARSGYVQGYCEAAAMGRELCACQCIECEAKENKAIAEASE